MNADEYLKIRKLIMEARKGANKNVRTALTFLSESFAAGPPSMKRNEYVTRCANAGLRAVCGEEGSSAEFARRMLKSQLRSAK